MPKCGNCKQSHPSVADVRACYEHDGKPTINTAPYPAKGEPMWPPSDKQVEYVLGLYNDKELPDAHDVKGEAAIRLMERDQVSAEINLLKTYPWKDRRASDTQREYTMPVGRYAIKEQNDTWHFYEITRSDKPRWKGYTFIKRLVGAPGSYNKVDVPRMIRPATLAVIEKDPQRAMLDYGLQSGVCGRCHSPLTDPDSLARGIGPKCATKSGWF